MRDRERELLQIFMHLRIYLNQIIFNNLIKRKSLIEYR